MPSDFFEWSDKYETGIRIIDNDHKLLFELAKSVNDHAESGKSGSEVSDVIDRLVQYVDQHFTREERIMAAAGFPDFGSHVSEHRRATEVIYAVQNLYRTDPDAVDLQKIANFFRDWLKKHIQGNDREYIPYVMGEKQGIKILNQDSAGSAPTPKFVSVEVHVPENKIGQLENCVRVLSHYDDRSKRLEAVLDELILSPPSDELARVAEKFKK